MEATSFSALLAKEDFNFETYVQQASSCWGTSY